MYLIKVSWALNDSLYAKVLCKFHCAVQLQVQKLIYQNHKDVIECM